MLKPFLLCTLVLIAQLGLAATREIFVSPSGNDGNPGTLASPLLSVEAAISAAGQGTAVTLRDGVYYLSHPIVLTPRQSGLTLRAYPGETPVISGGFRIRGRWAPYQNGIFRINVEPEVDTDQLFVNGVAQTLARYPNFDPNAKYFNGVAPDVLSPERVKRWSNPTGAFLHALHAYEWGDVHYRITGKDNDAVKLEGGWQNNRQVGMKEDVRFLEGVFEELDAPGEWFLDRQTNQLYYYPPVCLHLNSARVEGVKLANLIELQGTAKHPVRNVHISGITFRHGARTFMDNREPLLRSDWTIYRGGAIMATGTESCSLENCFLDSLGGNAVFVNGYNRHFTVRSCRIENAGANGVAFVGSPKAVRSPLFEYNERHSYPEIDLNPGPKTDDYPSECLVEDCLIDRTGRIEKQSAPIQIAMSRRITVRHCSIYDVPRAGINIGDGCWGGHVIEGCDVFDTVKETGDHGSFNSWGRDRYWGLKDVDLNHLDRDGKGTLPFLDTVEPNILRNNRWRCDHGWDVDLDDGSSNFKIIDNLCLNGGLKLREGFHRVCENNVIVNNSFHIHVWFNGSHDVLQKNVVFQPYHVIQTPPPFGDPSDFNFVHSEKASGPATELQRETGQDPHSLTGNGYFVDPARGDYRVKPNSPALQLGFKNFPMNQFGVRTPALRKIAKTPTLPGEMAAEKPDDTPTDWHGAKIKNLTTLGERSATGMPSETGVLIVSVERGGEAALLGFHPLDVILAVDNGQVATKTDLEALFNKVQHGRQTKFTIWRRQRKTESQITKP